MSTKPNIIFLDFDGVLVTPRASLAAGYMGEQCSAFDPVACSLVKRLCEEHNARIVVSSSWRIEYDSLKVIQAILNAACPRLGDYVWPSQQWWRTTTHSFTDDWQTTSDRGREIRNWIQNHETKFNRFVILDDMLDMRPLDSSLVICNYYNGFGWFEYQKASHILSGYDDL